MINLTENQIRKYWKNNFNIPVVSICCITYNHEKYIEKALDSFLMQETDFPFEILIHDDASTDDTQEIIKEYKKKFPNIIFPILQKENQYSKGIRFINPRFNFVRARGEFIAMCEGDDFWIDPLKLKIQISEMKRHPKINISFHPAYILYGKIIRQIMAEHSKTNKIFDIRQVIRGDGGFMPTSSIIIRKRVINSFPEWFYTEAPVGDYFIQIVGSYNYGALYINRIMSCYRINEQGWSFSIYKNFNKKEKFIKKFIKSLILLNDYYNGKYENEINYIIKKYYNLLINEHKNIKNFLYKLKF